ncbi:MAG: tRNA epoxyqueuosine(34) reductase QueG [Candidatus Acidiferrum sp.]
MCGVVRADLFPELTQMREWLDRGYAGGMKYLEDSRRQDPATAMPGIRSVIVCALNYNSDQALSTEAVARNGEKEPRGWISRYAWGRDYHEVIWEKLNALQAEMREQFPESFESRGYADTGPLAERVLAKYAGLGWLGKNTLLLNEEHGSWFFLGAILTTLDLQPSLAKTETPPVDRCGSCTRCLDACPTQAFVEPYVMDARRCISYLTIELKGGIPAEFREQMGWHVYGCDICQDVCPWNRKAPISNEPGFSPRILTKHLDSKNGTEKIAQRDSFYMPRLEWLAGMSEAEFREAFHGSAVKRTKWRGIVRNACIALGNSRMPEGEASRERIQALLRRLELSEEKTIAESARWALSRIS